MRRSGFMLAAAFLVASIATFSPQLGNETQAAGEFSSLSKPERLLDTRSGDKVGELDGSGDAVTLTVGGVRGIPSGVDAVAMNVTAVGTEASDFGGFVTVYPCGSRPDASNLNFVSNQTVANSVIAPVSSGGEVCFYVYGKAHLLADVSGYFTSGFESMTPKRIMDTRSDMKIGELDGSGMAYGLTVAGANGVPSDVDAVALNVTAVGTEANDFGGFVTVYPCGTRPDVSNLNFVSGQTLANSVIAPVSSTGEVCFYVYGKAHLLADVSGYFTSGFSALTPKRILDTRADGKVGELDGSGEAHTLTVTGKGGLPSSGIAAVAINVTAVGTEASDFGGFVTVYPCGTRPDASNLNFVSNQTIPNSVVAPVSSSGSICLYVYGKADLLVDVSGYLSSESSGDSGGSGDSGDSGETIDPNALTFDLDDAVGVALVGEAVSRTVYHRDGKGKVQAFETASNVLAVEADGSTRPASASGVADISRMLVAPNDKVYILFDQRVNLEDTSVECWRRYGDGRVIGWYTYQEVRVDDGFGGEYFNTIEVECEPPCLLGEINPVTGFVECIDNDLDSIQWNDWDDTAHDAIQFDDDGNVYYLGRSQDWTGVLRRYSNGSVEDLITDNIQIQDFLVTGDGSVYHSGYTESSSDNWLRVREPEGRLRTINGGSVTFAEEFPDGNVYFGETSSNWNIKRWLTSSKTVDDDPWLFAEDPVAGPCGSAFCVTGTVSEPGNPSNTATFYEYDYSTVPVRHRFGIEGCYTEHASDNGYEWRSGNWASVPVGDPERRVNYDEPFCYTPYSLAAPMHRTLSGEMFGIASQNDSTSVARYYPTPKIYTTEIEDVTEVSPILDYIVLAGSDSSNVYTITLLNLSTDSETRLLDADDEIEVYRMNISGNAVMFDGLRFSDGKYVIGTIDLSTGEVTASQTGSQRLVDFDTFG